MYATALQGTLSAIGTDRRLVWAIAAGGVVLLIATWWLLRRRSRSGRQGAAICITLSIVLHALLIYTLPLVHRSGGGAPASVRRATSEVAHVTFAELAEPTAASTGDATAAARVPLPLPSPDPQSPQPETVDASPPPEAAVDEWLDRLPESLQHAAADRRPTPDVPLADEALGDMLSQLWLDSMPAAGEPANPPPDAQADATAAPAEQAEQDAPAEPAIAAEPTEPADAAAAAAREADSVAASDAHAHSQVQSGVQAQQRSPEAADAGLASDFAQRSGPAKDAALSATGGDADTEAAVAAALRWLVRHQQSDGSWNPVASGAGQERSPLGLSRSGAGRSATMGLSGMALLALLGAGNTHQQGEYAVEVHAGLSYLIRHQAPDGSLAGNAGTYDRTYSHGIAALALCEAAAMTQDPAAIAAARAAVAYTARLQHPTTGGWRYLPGDPGDLSQLGWQAMVLSSARQAGIAVAPQTTAGAFRFLRSVRAGRAGGLACYRPGEAPTRTMTAEALASRLLLGEAVPQAELREAEAYLLAEPPGVGQDNYYYWYYASLALHQLQDAAWQQWNQRLKQRLIARQGADGSWPTDSVWGGYGGRVYTTAIGCLCLEVYYRHRRQPPAAVATESAPARLR